MSAKAALIVHAHAGVASIVMKVLARAGVQHASVVPDMPAARVISGHVQFDILLVDLHDAARAVDAFTSLSKAHRRPGGIVGVMAHSAQRAESLLDRQTWDFLVLKPFTPDELRLKLAPWIALQPAPPVHPEPDADVHDLDPVPLSPHRLLALREAASWVPGLPGVGSRDWQPIDVAPVQEPIVLRDASGNECLAVCETSEAYRILSGRLAGAPEAWKWRAR
jgi:CheY-like chemotaxis protein